ncbi:hypothetical protein A9Q94_14810 [Rhodobacterales bacterium 56_14_T64]|nr:hypothetical protein A9Q94_14810 [Rhodobacterales bacterium 56_14_T64]
MVAVVENAVLSSVILHGGIAKYGKHEILNTNQGPQFMGSAWITILPETGDKISMGRRGECIAKTFFERLWQSLKQRPFICMNCRAASKQNW